MADTVDKALAELRRGRMILVVDDSDRENEGDLIMAAEHASASALAFMIRHTSGLICVALTGGRADDLGLPLMVPDNRDPLGTAFTVSVDHASTTSTGISAADRAATARALSHSPTRPVDLTRPGHVFPLRAAPGGVLQRRGHTESAVDLCRLAGLQPAGILAEVTNDDGTMARRPQLVAFAQAHGLVMISVDDLVQYRLRTESTVRRLSSARIPLSYGEFRAVAFESSVDRREHVAMVFGDLDHRQWVAADGEECPILVRLHSECLTGDALGSCRCDCGEQLDAALFHIAAAGRGVVVYLRGHEGRGVGLAEKLAAYELQDSGLDTVDANLALGLPVDSRDYRVGADILLALGVRQVRLMTNNPMKQQALERNGVDVVERIPLGVAAKPENARYLSTKRERMGHFDCAPADRAQALPTQAS